MAKAKPPTWPEAVVHHVGPGEDDEHTVVRHCKSPTCNWYPDRRPECLVTLIAVAPGSKPRHWLLEVRKMLPKT